MKQLVVENVKRFYDFPNVLIASEAKKVAFDRSVYFIKNKSK